MIESPQLNFETPKFRAERSIGTCLETISANPELYQKELRKIKNVWSPDSSL